MIKFYNIIYIYFIISRSHNICNIIKGQCNLFLSFDYKMRKKHGKKWKKKNTDCDIAYMANLYIYP